MTKYALISDIHGNLPALQAVLADAARLGVDRCIFAGDYYMFLPYPNEVIGVLRQMKNAYIIKGNNEPYLDGVYGTDQRSWTAVQWGALYWCCRTITPENYRFLRDLPTEAEISTPGEPRIRVAHSSAEILGSPLFDRISSVKYKHAGISKDDYIREQIAVAAGSGLVAAIGEMPAGAYVFGHTHFQWHHDFDGRVFINPGSCGVPVDLDNRPAYTVLECDGNHIKVEERRVDYDIEGLIKDLRKSSLYEASKVWCELTIAALETGAEQHTHYVRFVEKYANEIGDSERPFSKRTWEEAYARWCLLAQ